MNITHGNILAVFFSASAAELCEGKEWYANANAYACALAIQYNIHVETAAGVIAALSPNNRWTRNLIDAEALIKVYSHGGDPRDVKVATFNKNKAKAIAILEGGYPLISWVDVKFVLFINASWTSMLSALMATLILFGLANVWQQRRRHQSAPNYMIRSTATIARLQNRSIR